MTIDDYLRRSPERECTPVISQPLPGPEKLFQRGQSQGAKIREQGDESRILLGYPLRLGLLKHYLRHKNMVWGQSIIPPGELPGIALIVGVYDLPENLQNVIIDTPFAYKLMERRPIIGSAPD